MYNIKKLETKIISNKDSFLDAEYYLSKSINSGEISKIKLPENTEFNLFLLKDIFIITNYGLVVNKNGRIIRECVANDSELAFCIDYLLTNNLISIKNILYLEEDFCSLLGPGNYIFSQWFLESLPKLIIAEKSGFKGKYIIPKFTILAFLRISPVTALSSMP